MGVPLSGPSLIYGDNMSVIHNTQRPELMLRKKLISICYHAVRESVAMGKRMTGHVSTHENPANVATKDLPGICVEKSSMISQIIELDFGCSQYPLSWLSF